MRFACWNMSTTRINRSASQNIALNITCTLYNSKNFLCHGKAEIQSNQSGVNWNSRFKSPFSKIPRNLLTTKEHLISLEIFLWKFNLFLMNNQLRKKDFTVIISVGTKCHTVHCVVVVFQFGAIFNNSFKLCFTHVHDNCFLFSVSFNWNIELNVMSHPNDILNIKYTHIRCRILFNFTYTRYNTNNPI